MQFADDFLEDSDSLQEEEEALEDPASFFITGTEAEAAAVPLQPAIPVVQLLPLVEVTRKLVSGMLSLSLFGDSTIGATVPGTIYDLSGKAKSARDKFAAFFQDNQACMRSEQYILAKSYDDMDKRASEIQATNRRLKSVIRSYGKRITDVQNGRLSAEISQLDSELKAVTANLKTAIGKLQEVHKEDKTIQTENEFYQEQMEEMMKSVRKRGGLSQRTRNLAKLELELANCVAEGNDAIGKMQNSVSGMVQPIEALKAKLADMDRRVGVFQYPQPVREPHCAGKRPSRRVKLS
jgi:hypothetical protein